MKLLILSNNPSRASFRQRIGDFLPCLGEQGIEAEVCKLPRNKIERWKLLKSAANYDAVLLHKKCLNFIDAKLLRKNSRKIIYDFDDAIMFSSSNPSSDSTCHYRLFKRTAGMVDVMVAGNEFLAEHARRFCGKVIVLPTALDTKIFDRSELSSKTDDIIRLVWIGSKSTLQYLAELKPALEELGCKYDNLVLRIIADEFFELENMPVEKVCWTLDGHVVDLMACDIGLAPLPDDRFTRGKCGFKILQYFAAGLPTIASPIGVNSEFLKKSKAGFLADKCEEWILAVERLMGDEVMRDEMKRSAKTYVSDFDSEIIGKRFAEIIKSQI